jgi:hypothetical protein
MMMFWSLILIETSNFGTIHLLLTWRLQTSSLSLVQKALKFGHLGYHFLKPGNFASISITKVMHFVHSEGLLNT